MNIIKHPNPILTTPSVDVELNDETLKFCREFLDFYSKEELWGRKVGLAAPQVGKNWNIFIALDRIYINPVMTVDPLGGTSVDLEGCYSLEDEKFDYPVRRHYKVTLEWTDMTGERQRRKISAFEAQVIQHEMDHLSGRLCVHHGTDSL